MIGIEQSSSSGQRLFARLAARVAVALVAAVFAACVGAGNYNGPTSGGVHYSDKAPRNARQGPTMLASRRK